jgi:hypothetical protein
MTFQGESILGGLVALALRTRWQVRTCYRPKWLNPWTKHDNIPL